MKAVFGHQSFHDPSRTQGENSGLSGRRGIFPGMTKNEPTAGQSGKGVPPNQTGQEPLAEKSKLTLIHPTFGIAFTPWLTEYSSILGTRWFVRCAMPTTFQLRPRIELPAVPDNDPDDFFDIMAGRPV